MVKTQNRIASLKITIHTFTQNHIFLILKSPIMYKLSNLFIYLQKTLLYKQNKHDNKP